jgi:hypothetical protein
MEGPAALASNPRGHSARGANTGGLQDYSEKHCRHYTTVEQEPTTDLPFSVPGGRSTVSVVSFKPPSSLTEGTQARSPLPDAPTYAPLYTRVTVPLDLSKDDTAMRRVPVPGPRPAGGTTIASMVGRSALIVTPPHGNVAGIMSDPEVVVVVVVGGATVRVCVATGMTPATYQVQPEKAANTCTQPIKTPTWHPERGSCNDGP